MQLKSIESGMGKEWAGLWLWFDEVSLEDDPRFELVGLEDRAVWQGPDFGTTLGLLEVD